MVQLYKTTDLRGVRDGICTWFGGAYDPPTRTYRTPQVPGLGVVRRGRPKSDNAAEYYLGAVEPGALIGSVMLVHLDFGVESRAAIGGAFGGLKQLSSRAVLHLFMRSNAEWAEDAQDGFYDLLDAVKDRIREDRCFGSGGFEVGGFQAGEGGEPWIRWEMAPAEVSREMTSAYASISFDVDFFMEG